MTKNGLPVHPSSRVQLNSENLLDIRRQMQASADSDIERMGRTQEEINASKQEMSNFLGRVFSHLKENVQITDNPEFNFNEPISTEEPLDESLIYAKDQAEQQLQLLAEKAIKIRKQKMEEISVLLNDMITQESRPARELNLVHGEKAKARYNDRESNRRNRSEGIVPELSQENIDQVVKEYSDSMKLLSRMEKSTKAVSSQLEHINRRSE